MIFRELDFSEPTSFILFLNYVGTVQHLRHTFATLEIKNRPIAPSTGRDQSLSTKSELFTFDGALSLNKSVGLKPYDFIGHCPYMDIWYIW